MKRVIAVLCAMALLGASVTVYADEKADRIAEIKKQMEELQKELDELTADGAASSAEASENDLTGDWVASNDTFNMSATITDDVITVYWESTDSKSLYWAGSFIAPENGEDPYTWTSENDHSQTDRALLASSSDTKDFTFEKGELSFEASAMGTTSTVRMKKK